MATKNPPLLYVGGLSGRVFVATKYRKAGGNIEVSEKFDVTDQFVAVAFELDEDWWNAKPEEAS